MFEPSRYDSVPNTTAHRSYTFTVLRYKNRQKTRTLERSHRTAHDTKKVQGEAELNKKTNAQTNSGTMEDRLLEVGKKKTLHTSFRNARRVDSEHWCLDYVRHEEAVGKPLVLTILSIYVYIAYCWPVDVGISSAGVCKFCVSVRPDYCAELWSCWGPPVFHYLRSFVPIDLFLSRGHFWMLLSSLLVFFVNAHLCSLFLLTESMPSFSLLCIHFSQRPYIKNILRFLFSLTAFVGSYLISQKCVCNCLAYFLSKQEGDVHLSFWMHCGSPIPARKFWVSVVVLSRGVSLRYLFAAMVCWCTATYHLCCLL